MKRRSIILAAVCFSTLLSGTQVMAESKVADSSEYASVEDVVEEPSEPPKKIFGGNDISDDDEKDDNYEDDD